MTAYILNLFDLVSTLLALSHGAVEMNPIVAFCITLHPMLYLLVKLAMLPLCMWLKGKKSYTAVCVVYAIFVVNNFAVIYLMH